MTTQTCITLAWMVGLYVSPEALTLQGNLTGISGLFFALPLAASLVLHSATVSALRRTTDQGWSASAEIDLLTDRYGPFAGTFLLLMARPVLAVCLATAVLVTAGFVFNEVFLYWFPNFGFAAVLLVAVLAINLAGPRVAAASQLCFTTTAVAGLAALGVLGLFNGDRAVPAIPETISWTTSSKGLALAAIAFLGYDMLRYTDQSPDQNRMTALIQSGLMVSGLLFLVWNTAALRHVAPSRLAETSIPHILSARAIMGPAGRVIIGVVAIAGACAAVNFLFQTVARMTVCMANHQLLPAVFRRSTARPACTLIALAATTAALMMMGFAGSDWLDVSIRAALLLWLGFYAAVLLAGQPKKGYRQAPGYMPPLTRHHTVSMLVAATMTLMAVTLVAVDDDPGALLKVLGVMLTVTAVLAGTGLLFSERFSFRSTLFQTLARKETNHEYTSKNALCSGPGCRSGPDQPGDLPRRRCPPDNHG